MASTARERPTFYARDRARWRRWLERNHARADGVWLVRIRAGVDEPCVSYDASVEEALCFGWIDGKVQPVDEEHYLQWFTARRPKSTWSSSNKERVRALIDAGKMEPAGMEAIARAKRNGAWTALDDIEKMVMPPDLGAALGRNRRAQANFDAFSPSNKRGYLAWVASAKRPETRARRIADTVRRAARNIKLQDAGPELTKARRQPASGRGTTPRPRPRRRQR